MCRRTQLLQHLRRDLLVAAQLRPSMNDTMPYRYWCLANVFLHCFSNRAEGMALRLEDIFLLGKRLGQRKKVSSVGRLLRPMPSALPVSNASSSWLAMVKQPKLQR